MKAKIIIGLILLTLCSCGSKFLDSLHKEISKLSDVIPPNSAHLISSMNSYLNTITNSIDKNKISQLGQLGVPEYTVDLFKGALYGADVKTNTFTFENTPSDATLIEGVGAISVVGNEARFAYVEAHCNGNLIPQKINVPTKQCKKRFLRKKKCWWNDNWVVRGFNGGEILLIKSALRAKSVQEIKKRIKALSDITTVAVSLS